MDIAAVACCHLVGIAARRLDLKCIPPRTAGAAGRSHRLRAVCCDIAAECFVNREDIMLGRMPPVGAPREPIYIVARRIVCDVAVLETVVVQQNTSARRRAGGSLGAVGTLEAQCVLVVAVCRGDQPRCRRGVVLEFQRVVVIALKKGNTPRNLLRRHILKVDLNIREVHGRGPRVLVLKAVVIGHLQHRVPVVLVDLVREVEIIVREIVNTLDGNALPLDIQRVARRCPAPAVDGRLCKVRRVAAVVCPEVDHIVLLDRRIRPTRGAAVHIAAQGAVGTRTARERTARNGDGIATGGRRGSSAARTGRPCRIGHAAIDIADDFAALDRDRIARNRARLRAR